MYFVVRCLAVFLKRRQRGSRLIDSCQNANQLGTCFVSPWFVGTVSSRVSFSASIPRCKALCAIGNSSVTLHVLVVMLTYYHLQNLVGVKNKSA